jgi:hypothetical protein
VENHAQSTEEGEVMGQENAAIDMAKLLACGYVMRGLSWFKDDVRVGGLKVAVRHMQEAEQRDTNRDTRNGRR